ncbi:MULTISPECIES: DUF4233 domain-containing protein [Thermomonosporaceae]|uniref:DUF4233 domain-containing protein n=1 Tax=Thermomonosporaceae TaxID=2012 RepID=UPI00255AD99D|nr:MULTISPECIES: DUF4233 domain-containing protein [Thermomonosporaceae]MDL4777770.1 DUF4233 domain-containing protein [Actinomadura xylanilytica]
MSTDSGGAADPARTEAAGTARTDAAGEVRTEAAGSVRGRAANPVARLLSAVLACEAIVIALAIPVAVSVLNVDGALAGLVCGGLAVVCVLMAGMLRFPWATPAGTVLQLLIIATGFMVPTMFFLGVLFGALWATALWMGRKAEAAAAR